MAAVMRAQIPQAEDVRVDQLLPQAPACAAASDSTCARSNAGTTASPAPSRASRCPDAAPARWRSRRAIGPSRGSPLAATRSMKLPPSEKPTSHVAGSASCCCNRATAPTDLVQPARMEDALVQVMRAAVVAQVQPHHLHAGVEQACCPATPRSRNPRCPPSHAAGWPRGHCRSPGASEMPAAARRRRNRRSARGWPPETAPRGARRRQRGIMLGRMDCTCRLPHGHRGSNAVTAQDASESPRGCWPRPRHSIHRRWRMRGALRFRIGVAPGIALSARSHRW